jgi:hypothetical protein
MFLPGPTHSNTVSSTFHSCPPPPRRKTRNRFISVLSYTVVFSVKPRSYILSHSKPCTRHVHLPRFVPWWCNRVTTPYPFPLIFLLTCRTTLPSPMWSSHLGFSSQHFFLGGGGRCKPGALQLACHHLTAGRFVCIGPVYCCYSGPAAAGTMRVTY